MQRAVSSFKEAGDLESGPIAAASDGPAARVALPGIEFSTVDTLAGFYSLEASWTALFERAGESHHLFQSYNWLWHWAQHFLPQDDRGFPKLSIVIARDQSQNLVLVMPLVLLRHGPVLKLVWMGEPVSQYGDVLIDRNVDRAALLDAAFAYIGKTSPAGLVHLRKIRSDAAVAPLIKAQASFKSNVLVAPYIDISSATSFDAFEERYAKSARRNRKRQRRRLEDHGAQSLEVADQGLRARDLANQGFDLKIAWLKDKSLISPALSDERTRAFFLDVCEAKSHPAGCAVTVLKSGDQIAALEISVSAKGRTAIHIITYAKEFEKAAAGALLMEDSIRRAIDAKQQVFDLLAPGAEYKYNWTDTDIEVADYAVALSGVGYLYSQVYLNFIRQTGKRFVEHLPPSIRRFAAGIAPLAVFAAQDITSA